MSSVPREGKTKMDSVISTKDLRKSFRSQRGAVEAVRGVSFEVNRGEIFGFLGPNGAGKTTTLRMLTTLLPIDSGSAVVAGFDVGRHPKEVRERIGYVSQLGGRTTWPRAGKTWSSRAGSTAKTCRRPRNELRN